MTDRPPTRPHTGSGPAEAGAAEPAGPVRGFPLNVSLGIGLGTMLQPLNSSMIAVAIVAIAAHYGASGEVSWVISGLYIATAVAAPMTGSLGTMFGPRRVYLTGLALILAGGLLGAFAPTLGWLIFARVLLGLGTASQYPNAMTIVRVIATERRRTTSSAISVLTICAQAMVALGPTLGGLLVGTLGWQSIMWVNVPVVIACATWVLRVVPDIPPVREQQGSLITKLDPVGAVGFVITIGTLMYFLLSLTNRPVWWLVPIILVVGAAFVWWELRAVSPFLPIRTLIGNRQLASTIGRTLITYLAFYGIFFGVPQWLQGAAGYSAELAGLLMLPMAVVSIVVTMVASRVVRRRGPRLTLAIGTVALALGGAVLAFVEGTGVPLWVLIGCSMVLGIPNAFNNIANQSLINTVTRVSEISPALGMYRMTQYIAANLSSVIVALTMRGAPTDAGLHLNGMVILGAAVVLGIALVFARTMPTRVRV